MQRREGRKAGKHTSPSPNQTAAAAVTLSAVLIMDRREFSIVGDIFGNMSFLHFILELCFPCPYSPPHHHLSDPTRDLITMIDPRPARPVPLKEGRKEEPHSIGAHGPNDNDHVCNEQEEKTYLQNVCESIPRE